MGEASRGIAADHCDRADPARSSAVKGNIVRLKSLLLASSLLAVAAMPAEAAVSAIVDNSFSSNPFASPNLLSGFLAGTANWYGAQHGVTGGTTGAFTMAWRGTSPGADGANGYVGYSPTTRYFETLLTRLPGGPVGFGQLVDLSIETRNAANPGNPAGLVRAAIHTGGTGGTWYVSTSGVSGNSATSAWVPISFSLQSLTYQSYGNDNNLPNPGLGGEFKGPVGSLGSSLAVDWVGIFVDYSGQNSPNSGDVLRFDNFKLTAQTAVPEPVALGLLLAGIGGLAATRRATQRPGA